GFDLRAAEVELLLGPVEDLVPQARLLVALHLGQIEVGSAPALQQAPRVMEDVQAEVEHRAGYRSAIDRQVTLHEVPPSRAHDECRDLIVEFVLAAVGILE